MKLGIRLNIWKIRAVECKNMITKKLHFTCLEDANVSTRHAPVCAVMCSKKAYIFLGNGVHCAAAEAEVKYTAAICGGHF